VITRSCTKVLRVVRFVNSKKAYFFRKTSFNRCFSTFMINLMIYSLVNSLYSLLLLPFCGLNFFYISHSYISRSASMTLPVCNDFFMSIILWFREPLNLKLSSVLSFSNFPSTKTSQTSKSLSLFLS